MCYSEAICGVDNRHEIAFLYHNIYIVSPPIPDAIDSFGQQLRDAVHNQKCNEDQGRGRPGIGNQGIKAHAPLLHGVDQLAGLLPRGIEALVNLVPIFSQKQPYRVIPS